MRRAWDHIEVRLALLLVALAAPVLAITLFFSFAYAAHEMLEARGEQLTELASAAAAAVETSAPPRLQGPLFEMLVHEGVAIRLRDGSAVLASRGEAVAFHHRLRDADSTWDAVFAGRRDVVAATRAAGAYRVEAVASLDAFVDERAELAPGFWISFLLGVVGSVLFAIVATRYALRPLREATLAIASINENRLTSRLPVRHTGDAVDLHAQALNQTLERLQSGFERVGAFSADVAHELRTPINRLLNQSGTRLLAPADAEGFERTLLSVQTTAEEMNAIVEGLLLLARADEGRLPTRATEFELLTVLDRLREVFEPACDEQRVHLEVKADGLKVVGDEGLVVRCLSNLLDNALSHTPAGGYIAIAARTQDDGVVIRVCDTGRGVPESELERIFDRFARVNPTHAQRGAGLGLAIARAIATAHGGTLRAQLPTNGGTCFELWLPRCQAASEGDPG